jgi:3-oxoacyl-[acyl-carrier protein] reductase
MLNGKIALVTGAATGIGRACAIDLAKHGAGVALNYFGNKTEAENVRAEILKHGVKCEIYDCDVSNFKKSKEMCDTVLRDFGRVDILVNNAGIEISNSIARMGEDDWDRVLGVNLKGCFNMIKHLYLNFAKRDKNIAPTSAIINNASVCGLRGWQWQANYSAAKGGLISLTKTVAKELGGRGVTCNAIAPGFIETDMTARATNENKAELIKTIPLGRMGTPQDVANVVTFLASPMAAYVTGEVIKIDGGMCI